MTEISILNDVQKIIVLDYGSQYNQLIARRIREFGVFPNLKAIKSPLKNFVRSIPLVSFYQADLTLSTLITPLLLTLKSLN